MRLTTQETGFLKLIQRSPANAEGWRQVSPLLWRFVRDFTRPELLEAEPGPEGEGGRVRFSDRGAAVADYL